MIFGKVLRYQVASCKRLFGFQTSESCTSTARWPANTTAELAVYWIWKRTEETISRKKLAFVHLRFRVMFRRSNKECHLVFSMKYLLFQGRFGWDERFPFERDERFRSGECGGRRRSKGSDMWLVMGGKLPAQKWFAEAELLRVQLFSRMVSKYSALK